LAIYSLRSRAGFFSHRRRSWDSPFGVFSFRKVFGSLQSELAHLPFNPVVFPPPKRRAGPIGPGFWALTLPEIPDGWTKFLDRRPLDTPLGFALLGSCRENLDQGFPQSPLTRFCKLRRNAVTEMTALPLVYRRPRVSLGFRPVPTPAHTKVQTLVKTTLLGFLHLIGPTH
jgi:hypothetical protein